jgi:hypothetical protein
MNATTRTLSAPRQRGVTRDEKSSAMRRLPVCLEFDRREDGFYERWHDV